MDFASRFRGDRLSQDLRETGGFRRRELGVVEGRKPRSVRISGSEVDLDRKTSRDEITEGEKKKAGCSSGERSAGRSHGRRAQHLVHAHCSTPDRSEPQPDRTGQRSQPGA